MKLELVLNKTNKNQKNMVGEFFKTDKRILKWLVSNK